MGIMESGSQGGLDGVYIGGDKEETTELGVVAERADVGHQEVLTT